MVRDGLLIFVIFVAILEVDRRGRLGGLRVWLHFTFAFVMYLAKAGVFVFFGFFWRDGQSW